jgi:DnaJ-domain-containing protein 1
LKKNYYQLLGIAPQASGSSVKSAYRKQAMKHHPDKVANESSGIRRLSEQEIRKLNEAYEVLMQPERRQLYDLCLNQGRDFHQAEADAKPESSAERNAREAEELLLSRALRASVALTVEGLCTTWPEVGWKDDRERDRYFDALLIGSHSTNRYRVHLKVLPELSPAHILAIQPYAEALLHLTPPSLIREHHNYLIVGRNVVDAPGVQQEIVRFNHRFWASTGPREPRAFIAWSDVREGEVLAPGISNPELDLTRLILPLGSLFRA